MIKIDIIKLFRVFVVLEVVLVGIPMVAYWSVEGVLCLVDGFNPVTFFLNAVLVFYSFYFLLPRLITSTIFPGSLTWAMSKGVAGWLLVISAYSVLALLFALLLTIYLTLRKQKKLRAERTVVPDSENR